MPGRIDVNLGRVGTRAAPTPYGNQRAPDNTQEIQQTFDRFGAMGKAIGNDLGKQLQQKEELEARKAYEAKQDADKVKVSDSLTALKKRGTDEFYGTQQPDSDAAADAAFDERDTQEGYLSKNGANAVEEGTPTFERLEKKRQQLLDALENDDQKKMFLEHSDRLLDGYYGQIESHSARERERQKVDSLKNAESEALRATTLDPANDKLAQESIGNIVGLQDSFTTSVGDAFSKAEDVQGRITMGRLEALLATDGGFVDAERVLEQNKGSLGTKYDDYKKRVDAAKLGGTAAVEANRIVEQAMPAEGEQQSNYRMPNDEVAFQELAKLSPQMQQKVAPMVAQRMALRKAAIKEQRDAFVDRAVGTYNKKHGAFFSSDMADRLNKVDPDKYRALWNESFARWRAAGDDSARARREQADRDKEALYDYQAYGDGDVAQRTGLNLETWLAGRGVSDTGAARIRAAQSGDKAKQEKGLGVGESGFVRDTKAELSKFAPDPGTTQKSRAAAAQWWAERNADAINAYTTWVDSHPGKKPTAEEVAKLKASVISGVRPNPKKPESIGAAARALTVQGGAGKPSRTGRKKVFNGVTYWELSDGNAERE